jgi:hypothetical protein
MQEASHESQQLVAQDQKIITEPTADRTKSAGMGDPKLLLVFVPRGSLPGTAQSG